MNPLKKLLETGEPILLDGAMGTMLMDAGLIQGDPPEEWNVIHPERVRAVHKGYIDAGSRVILTNSFGGTSFRLEMHNLQDRVVELNKAAAQVARAEADAASYTVVVAGSMGPTRQIFEPMGTLTYDEAVAAFAEQAKGLAEGGVDVFWVETMSDLSEVQAAVEGHGLIGEKAVMLLRVPLVDQPQAAHGTVHGPAMPEVLGQVGIQQHQRDGQPFERPDVIEARDRKQNDTDADRAGKSEMQPAAVGGADFLAPVRRPIFGNRPGGCRRSGYFASNADFSTSCMWSQELRSASSL